MNLIETVALYSAVAEEENVAPRRPKSSTSSRRISFQTDYQDNYKSGRYDGLTKDPFIVRRQQEDYLGVLENERITLNICGRRFDVPRQMLMRHPETLLGDAVKLSHYYCEEDNEYYFNRNRLCCEAIIEYYQTEILRRPNNVPLDLFVAEAVYFELGNEALVDFCKDEGYEKEEPEPLPENFLQRQIWQFVEYPQSSTAAKVFAILSCLVILLSIVVFCLETVPKEHLGMQKIGNETGDHSSNHFQTPFFIIESICIAWFTIEFILRFISCPDKRKFMRVTMNIIDLLAIVPFYIDLVVFLASANAGADGASGAGAFTILRIIRLVRIFRIFKLSRHSKGLQILGQTFMMSMRELGLLLLFLSIGVVLFSSAIYYAEQNVEETQFSSIPYGFWWAIVTMTTVGYGDIAPVGLLGKIIGAACAVSGLIAVALPVPVIVNNFSTIYQRERDRPMVERILNDAFALHEYELEKKQQNKLKRKNGKVQSKEETEEMLSSKQNGNTADVGNGNNNTKQVPV